MDKKEKTLSICERCKMSFNHGNYLKFKQNYEVKLANNTYILCWSCQNQIASDIEHFNQTPLILAKKPEN